MPSNVILIVEDDSAINNLIAEILQRENYQTVQAFSGSEAKLLLGQQSFDLILLDLMLPGCSGEELIRHIRSSSEIPVIVLSAKDSLQSKVGLLQIGADDYMTKPFEPEELLARVQAALRRTQKLPQPDKGQLRYRDVVLDQEGRTVTVADQEIELTGIEFAILEVLMSNPKKVFTKANLYQSVWNDEFFGDDNTVNVHISKIRSKLGGDYIHTVWGIGYKMQEENK